MGDEKDKDKKEPKQTARQKAIKALADLLTEEDEGTALEHVGNALGGGLQPGTIQAKMRDSVERMIGEAIDLKVAELVNEAVSKKG